jgi:hypothetical protein
VDTGVFEATPTKLNMGAERTEHACLRDEACETFNASMPRERLP